MKLGALLPLSDHPLGSAFAPGAVAVNHSPPHLLHQKSQVLGQSPGATSCYCSMECETQLEDLETGSDSWLWAGVLWKHLYSRVWGLVRMTSQ